VSLLDELLAARAQHRRLAPPSETRPVSLNALAWVANHLGSRGLGLRPGEVVMSGSVSTVLRPAAGDTVQGTFTRLGSVSVRFV